MIKQTTVKETNGFRRRIFELGAMMYKFRYLYLLAAPSILYFAVFRFAPMYGFVLAFKKYSPFKGINASPWCGFDIFKEMFCDPFFFTMLRNTFVIALLKLVFYFPIPILLAIMINEVRHRAAKRIIQTVVYFPHFLSWVVVASLTYFTLSVNVGWVNQLIYQFGGEQFAFLIDEGSFWPMILIQTIWKESGWGTIIFLSAITMIDEQLYEAAIIDGASRLQRIWHITLPDIRPTIITMLILRLGQVFDVGFEQVLLMQNSMVRDVAEIFDTYSYNQGIMQGQFSLGVAVGLFKSGVGLIFLAGSNWFVKKIGFEGIY